MKVKGDLLDIYSDEFKKFFNFLFTFNLAKKTNKVLPLDVYSLYLKDLFGIHFKLVDEFLLFMQKSNPPLLITEDQWQLFLNLLKEIGDDFPNNYNVEEAWPTLFDEFYEWYCKKYDIKIEKPQYD